MSRFALGIVLLAVSAAAQPWVPGQSYFGRNNYVEFRPGDLPLIVTAPHGGSLEPNEIPDRNGSGDVTGTDRNTIELAEAIAQAVFTRTGRRPHLVLSHLHRKKLDPNREIVEAARGNTFAEQAWAEYHGFIETARALAEAEFGFGFVADMHGHGHDIQRLELGYNYSGTELNESDAALNRPGYAWMGYLRTLLLHRPGVPFHTMLRGEGSLGDLLNRYGDQKAWPSPQFPAPGSAPFFAGGYSSDRHTCLLDNSLITGVQFECHFDGVRNNASSRNAFGTQLANALQPYLHAHYGFHLGTRSLFAIAPPATTTLARGGGPVTLTVNRTGWAAYTLELPLEFSGTAVAGTDYTVSASSLSFAHNQLSHTVTITPATTGAAAGDRTLIVRLAPPVTESADTTPLVLTLGDGLSQTVRVQAPAPVLPESAGAASYRLTRTHTAAALTVPLQWSGTARAEADYHDAPVTAHFPAGDDTAEILVPLVDDGRAGPDRTLTLTVAPGAGHVVGHPASATVRIRDDDRPAQLAVWLRGELADNIAHDSSGHDRHGTTLPADSALATGPTPLAVGGGGTAINFDGNDDTLALPRFTPDPAGAFTVAFFFRLQSASSASNQSLLSYGTRGGAGSLHIYLNNSTTLRTSLPGLSNSVLDLTGVTWQNNSNPVWRHYALSVGADGTARVYLNGALQKTAAGRTGTLAMNELFWLGWRPAARNDGGYMRGALRDFRVYQRPLGAAEIAALAAETQTYPAWLAQNALPAGLAATADPDGNGHAALLEYALAAPVASAGLPPRYTVTHENNRVALRFLRESAASDVTWFVEASADLEQWQSLARRGPADAQWVILAAGTTVTEENDVVTARDAVPAAPAPRFLRLRLER